VLLEGEGGNCVGFFFAGILSSWEFFVVDFLQTYQTLAQLCLWIVTFMLWNKSCAFFSWKKKKSLKLSAIHLILSFF
jgi:hypothetical protein